MHLSPDASKLTITRRGLLRTGFALAASQAYPSLRLLAAPLRRTGSVAPCLAAAGNAYPPLLQRFIDKLDPAADVFEEEVYVVELETVLAAWTSELQTSLTLAKALSGMLAEQIEAPSLKHSAVAVLRSTPPFFVERHTFSPASKMTRASFIRDWQDSLASFIAVEVAEFEIYGLRITSTNPLGLQVDLHYDLVGSGQDGGREQRNGSWSQDWRRGDGGEWRVDRWTFHPAVRSRLTGPGFRDITANVLSPHSPASAQLAFGIDHWRSVLDAATGIDVYGNHGVAAGDLEGAGFDSVYVCQPAGLPNRLLRNRRDGTFEDITDISGTGLLDGTASAIFADFSNRGMQDLVVVRSSGPILFHNLGGGRFQQQADAFHFARPPQGTFTSAAVADYNRDGLLDVYFCVYSYYQGLNQYEFPTPYYDAQNGPPNFLFRNRGDGTFEDVTVPSGMDMNNNRFSFAAEWCDYDNDGWPDLFVANDFGRKNLYRNQRNGTFADVAAEAGVEDYGPGMSTCWIDYDNDGKQDLYVANMWLREGKRITANPRFLPHTAEPVRALYRKHNAGNSLFRNTGTGKFQDQTAVAGAERGGWSWSCAAWDIDEDGWPDLYVANGFVSGPRRQDLQSFFWRQVAQRSAAGASTDYEMAWNAVNELVRSDYSWSGYQRNNFYLNHHDGTFSDVAGLVGLDLRDDSRAFALTDLDGDGRLEVILKNRTGPQLRILSNQLQNSGHFIAVRLIGTKSNRDAIGAIVNVETHGTRQTHQLSAGSGFASQHTKTMFFGLGESAEPVNITVHWPSGGSDRYDAVPANVRATLEEGSPKAQTSPFVARKAYVPLEDHVASRPASAGETLRTWLAAPLFGPELTLIAQNGTTHSLRALSGSYVVLVFLDLTCASSAEQLATLRKGKATLASAGIAIYAVALQSSGTVVENPGNDTFPVMPATAEELAAWNVQYRYLFDRRRNLDFPTSFLLEPGGAAVCVYQGHVAPEQLILDAKVAPATAEERRALAMPFPGSYLGNSLTRDYFTYAVAFVEYGLVNDAEAALKQDLKANPEHAAAWFNLGTVYLNKKQYPDAQKALRQAVRLNPQDADAWNNLGLIAGEQENYAEALEDFRNSARADPNHLTAVENMMRIYQFQSRPAEAQQALEELLAKAPASPDLHLALAMALVGQNETTGGKRELERAIELRPTFVDAINNLGTVLLQTGDTPAALKQFERCRQLDPDFDRAVLNEALIYSRGGQTAKAQELLRAFVASHPENAETKAMLQKLGGD